MERNETERNEKWKMREELEELKPFKKAGKSAIPRYFTYYAMPIPVFIRLRSCNISRRHVKSSSGPRLLLDAQGIQKCWI